MLPDTRTRITEHRYIKHLAPLSLVSGHHVNRPDPSSTPARASVRGADGAERGEGGRPNHPPPQRKKVSLVFLSALDIVGFW